MISVLMSSVRTACLAAVVFSLAFANPGQAADLLEGQIVVGHQVLGLSGTCELCICDVNNSGSVTATDALTVLQAAVGADVTLTCPACEE